jgi:hypothetical protein
MASGLRYERNILLHRSRNALLQEVTIMASIIAKPSLDRLKRALLASGILLIAAHADAEPRSGGPFLGMSGQWSGAGTITMANGAAERIRCRALNSVGAAGDSFRQSLRCASESYRLDISSNVVSEGGMLSGSWSEATRGVSGNVSGRASGRWIVANIVGANFAARLDMRTQDDRQSVTLRPEGTDVAAVSIALHKR